jgi:adenylate kinase
MEARLLKRGETSGRSDDNAETIRKRFKTFVDQSLPVIDHYEAEGKAYKISATATPNEVFKHVSAVIDKVYGGKGAAANGKAPARADKKASRKVLKLEPTTAAPGVPTLAMA